MQTPAYSLMGFRHDPGGGVFAAFSSHRTRSYAFELPATRQIAAETSEAQERWARTALHEKGHLFHGLFLSDLAPDKA